MRRGILITHAMLTLLLPTPKKPPLTTLLTDSRKMPLNTVMHETQTRLPGCFFLQQSLRGEEDTKKNKGNIMQD